MPKGPKGERRPADTVSAAIRVGRIAVGDEPEDAEETPRAVSEAARAMGKLGGKARAQSMPAAKRKNIKMDIISQWI